MESTKQRPKLVVIVGPTASGKSDLAIKLAKELNGEIICADSRTIYKGMNIGTAKPSLQDRKAVSHWGLDLVKPGQNYNAAKFKEYAQNKLNDIQKRGKLPILVGGTGLYIDGVLFDLSFVKVSKIQRLIYSSWTVQKLQKKIQQKKWPMPHNSQNKRHLIAVVSRRGKVGNKKTEPSKDALIIGLMPSDELLKQLIKDRAAKYFEYGLIEETRQLLSKYGQKKLSKTGGIANIAAVNVIKGDITVVQATEQIATQEWQYARRQKTWFKRNKFIKWFKSPEHAYKHILTILNN